MSVSKQPVPRASLEREALREKGQFWTPAWVAEAMVGYTLQGDADHIFDPAVGAGAFFHAAKVVGQQIGRPVTLLGTELDPLALTQAAHTGLSAGDLENVQVTNYVLDPPAQRYKAIVANPSYIRHHRLSSDVKSALKLYTRRLMGTAIDGRAGLHVYFLLRALEQLHDDGRLAFIMSADTCEGVFAPRLWTWITARYCLDAVVTFAPNASPFPGVDTNAIVFMIRKAPPETTFLWARCTRGGTDDLKAWTLSGLTDAPTDGTDAMEVYPRQLDEALTTGLSRPAVIRDHDGVFLGDYATVMRGIATGANEFFFLTTEQAHSLALPDGCLRVAVGRTGDVAGEEITNQSLHRLEATGRPTRLLSLDGRPIDDFPPHVRSYLYHGEQLGLPMRALIAQRRPWYKMEVRVVPPFLFAYLGRRNARFIRNSAGVVPLTGFLCIYPHSHDPSVVERLWQVLRHPATVANLFLIGKSYGSGAIKVEPRALERLPLPQVALDGSGLIRPTRQMQLPYVLANQVGATGLSGQPIAAKP